MSRQVCEDVIKAAGKGVESSLKGFAAGYAYASGEAKPRTRAEIMAHLAHLAHLERRGRF